MLTGLKSVQQEGRKNYNITLTYGVTERFLRFARVQEVKSRYRRTVSRAKMRVEADLRAEKVDAMNGCITISHVTAARACVRVIRQALPIRFRAACWRFRRLSTAGHPPIAPHPPMAPDRRTRHALDYQSNAALGRTTPSLGTRKCIAQLKNT